MKPEQQQRLEEHRIETAMLKKKKAEEDARKREQEPEKVSRPGDSIRASLRAHANRLNPNPAARILDSRGRPKQPTDHHQHLGSGKL